jgi:hypothetical protein
MRKFGASAGNVRKSKERETEWQIVGDCNCHMGYVDRETEWQIHILSTITHGSGQSSSSLSFLFLSLHRAF